ncbi:MAG: Ribonuclease Y [Chlamydiae bacterium]|nr:Ribonuclease Y [Chlamydiota bacterium]
MWVFHRLRLGNYKNLAQDIINKAELQTQIIQKNSDLEIKQRQEELLRKTEESLANRRQKTTQHEDRIKEREDKLERRMGLIEKKLLDIDKREAIIQARREQLEEDKKMVTETHQKLLTEMEHLAGLSAAEAKEAFLNKISTEVKADVANIIRKAQREAKEECERIASSVIATSINRMAVSTVSETSVVTVAIPHDEMKGRIVGRDGRNIRALERLSGVNFLIDETPGVIVISGFDPIRKYIAKFALTDLVNDGRIHPSRIEEAIDKATVTVQKQIKKYGEDAALRVGAVDLQPEILDLLGKLKFRYSYGQNVLEHSLEVSHLMGIMASELGLNVALAKRIGLLHDIGKAISHEIEGTHALIGRDFVLKHGESEEVANGVGCHHEEIPPITIEGSLCGSADKISASRPGARVEAAEEYFKRLKKLEDLAYEFPGIEQAYAMQAGREIRIVVMPEMIDDNGILNLARDLSKKIENDLKYSGKIKITVIREKRAVEYAV